MRIKDAKSLLWLSRWYNGRADRLGELYDLHVSDLETLVREALGKRKSCYHRKLTLCGVKVVVTLTEYGGLQLHDVGPADHYSGIQRELFVPVAKLRRKPELKIQEVRHEAAA